MLESKSQKEGNVEIQTLTEDFENIDINLVGPSPSALSLSRPRTSDVHKYTITVKSVTPDTMQIRQDDVLRATQVPTPTNDGTTSAATNSLLARAITTIATSTKRLPGPIQTQPTDPISPEKPNESEKGMKKIAKIAGIVVAGGLVLFFSAGCFVYWCLDEARKEAVNEFFSGCCCCSNPGGGGGPGGNNCIYGFGYSGGEGDCLDGCLECCAGFCECFCGGLCGGVEGIVTANSGGVGALLLMMSIFRVPRSGAGLRGGEDV